MQDTPIDIIKRRTIDNIYVFMYERLRICIVAFTEHKMKAHFSSGPLTWAVAKSS